MPSLPFAPTLRHWLAQRLERGKGVALPWPSRPLRRALRLPVEVPVVGVGGALLGGSGRTPLSLALAEQLAAHGARVGLIGHGYRPGTRRAPLQRVHADSDPRQVGDEARMLAQASQHLAVQVWVGPRQAAIDAASSHCDVLVLDGLLQSAPMPLALSVLALSAPSPWGSLQRVPRGDLLAAPEHLLALADVAVELRLDDAPSEVAGALRAQQRCALPAGGPAPAQAALLLGVARAERIEHHLCAAHGPFAAVVRTADHQAAARHEHLLALWRSGRIQGVYASPKCAAALPLDSPLPRFVLEHTVQLPPGIWQKIRAPWRTCPPFVHLTVESQTR